MSYTILYGNLNRLIEHRLKETGHMFYTKPDNPSGFFSEPGKRPRLEIVHKTDIFSKLSVNSCVEDEQEIDLAVAIIFNSLFPDSHIHLLVRHRERILNAEGQVVQIVNSEYSENIKVWWQQVKEQLANTSSLSKSMCS